jgi:tetratricopeptide (TPR) repeat protein
MVLGFTVFFSLFVVPLNWTTVPQAKVLFAGAFVVVALVWWLMGNVSRRRMVFSFDPILIAAFLIPVAYSISAFVSGSSFSSLVSADAIASSVAGMLLLFGVALCGAVAVEKKHISLQIILAFVVSGACVMLFQIARLFIPELLTLNGVLGGSTSSIVGSWHDLAIFSTVLVLITFGLLETSLAEYKIVQAALIAISVLSLGILTVVNFSDAWYILAGALFLFAIASVLKNYRRTNDIFTSLVWTWMWVLLIVIALSSGYFGATIYGHLPSKFQISQSEVRPSWQGTFTAGPSLYQGGKALVFGSGPNTFARQWAQFKPPEVNATDYWNTDFQYGYGVIPTAFVTVGLVGSMTWVLLFLALLWAGYRSFAMESEGKLRVILFVVCAVLMFYHVVYVPSIGISVLLFLFLGVFAGLDSTSWREGKLSLTLGSLAGFVMILVCTCLAIGGSLVELRSMASSLLVSRAASTYQTSGDLTSASSLVSKAVQIDPQSDVAQRAAVQVGLLQFSKLAQSATNDTAARDALQKTLSDTIAHGLEAVSIDNASYQNWLALATMYQSLAGVGIQGAYEQAQNAWLRAASTTPSNPLPLVQLGQLYMAQSKNVEAVNYFTKAIQLKPNLALPYFLRAQIKVGEQKYQEAVQDAVAAAQIANQDSLSWYGLGIILYRAGDTQNAKLSLERAVSIQNNYSDALFALAVLYDATGEHDKALDAIKKVSALNPNDATITQVMQNLQSGRPALAPAGTLPSATPSSPTKKR